MLSLRADTVVIEPRPRAMFAAAGVRMERSTFAASAIDVSPARPWLAHVDFKAIVRRTEYVERRAARRLANLVARAVWRIVGDREALAALLDEDVSDIGRLKLQARDVASLRATCVEALRESWAVGRRQAAAEAKRAAKLKMAALDTRDLAASYFEANGFRMAQNLSDGARALIQSELTRAVRVGERPEAVARSITERLIERGFTDYEGIDTEVDDEALLADLLDLDDPDRLPHYVNTLVRTNTFEAMNEARYAYYTDPALEGYVVAFEYSAVLDENTTEFCRYMDGRVYAADNAVWDTHRPPNHFNALAEGSLITTARGAVPIERIVAGNLVLTHRGRYRPVYAVMRKAPDRPALLAVHLDSGHILRATDEHPVLTAGGWKRADELQVGDVLFERSQDVFWVRDVALPDPQEFPTLFDEPAVPYEITSATFGPSVAFAVEFERDSRFHEGEVEDVTVGDELEVEGCAATHQDIEHRGLGDCGFAAHGARQTGEDIRPVRVPRVAPSHAGGAIGTEFAKRPVTLAGALGDDFGQAVGDGALLLLRADRDTVSSAPAMQHAFSELKGRVDAPDGFAFAPVATCDEALDGSPVSQVDHEQVPWRGVRVTSIVEVDYTRSVWNLAVLDDESYVAEGIVVHNCRSLLIPITKTAGWDGVESEPPEMEPAAGFVRCTHAEGTQ